jgi:hypothetical protein
MYSYFICPSCNKKSFQSDRLPESGVVISATCKRCKKPIKWVANTDDAKQVRGLVAISGGIATLADKEPGVAIGNNEDVANLVTTRTPAKLADAYRQAERHMDYTPTWTDVKEGVCEGQCLHWLRRVLTGGRLVYKPRDPSKSRGREQQIAGATVQRALKGNVINSIRQQNWQNIVQQAQDKGYTQARVDALAKNFEQATKYRYDWDAIAEKLDEKTAEAGVGRTHGFSGIVCIKSDNLKDFGEGPRAFVEALMADEKFEVGTGVLISSNLQGSGENGGTIGGHAIAAYFKSSDVLLFFDPNVGIFHCKTKDDLTKALAVLMGSWSAIKGWTLTNKFGYSVFTNRETPGEVRAREKHVPVTGSAQGTYYANKTVLPGK